MDLQKIRTQRLSWLKWKNIAPLREAIDKLPDIETKVCFEDTITVTCKDGSDTTFVKETAMLMKPWRKGPFDVCGVYIDAEWKSFIKYNIIYPHCNLYQKKVADIGCNNGYYMFRMLNEKPAKIVGFDPSALFKTQFDFINHFVKSDIVYELLGVEHLPFYQEKFDVIFCLGVLYHRSDPVNTLKHLYKGLESNGEVILDTFYIEGDGDIALTPKSTYSKIPNIYFIPTINAFENWAKRAGFSRVEVLKTVITSQDEQRKTDWIDGQSLNEFLDNDDITKTVEGYPAPRRLYVKLYKERNG